MAPGCSGERPSEEPAELVRWRSAQAAQGRLPGRKTAGPGVKVRPKQAHLGRCLVACRRSAFWHEAAEHRGKGLARPIGSRLQRSSSRYQTFPRPAASRQFSWLAEASAGDCARSVPISARQAATGQREIRTHRQPWLARRNQEGQPAPKSSPKRSSASRA
jgi:hypothetical protein